MYKTRIKQWGLGKNNKDSEMRAIVRKKKQRLDRGKGSIIQIRGKAVDDREVARYWKRKGISLDEVIAQRTASATPEAVELFTPVPSRLATPEAFAVPERLFVKIRDYLTGSFESGNWAHGKPQIDCRPRDFQGDVTTDLAALEVHNLTACQLLSSHSYQEAGQNTVSATSVLKNILLAEYPGALGRILDTVMIMRLFRRHEIALAILRQYSALGKLVMGNEQPLRLICGWLALLDASQFDEITARCLRSVTDHFESFLGLMHLSTLTSRIYYVAHVNRAQDISQRDDLLHNLLGQCELQLGTLDLRTFYLRYALAMHYLDGCHYFEALKVGQDLVAYAQHPQSPGNVRLYYAQGLYIAARSQYALGETISAEANLREAIESSLSSLGPHNSQARFWLVRLEEWLLEQGRSSSAAEVRETRMRMIDPTELI